MKTAVIGSGNMGTAMALVLADNGHSVACWDHVPEVVEDIRKNHHNQRYLPGANLPPYHHGRSFASPCGAGSPTHPHLRSLPLFRPGRERIFPLRRSPGPGRWGPPRAWKRSRASA